jgi:hypothetical protein
MFTTANDTTYSFVQKDVCPEGGRILVQPKTDSLGKKRCINARDVQTRQSNEHDGARDDVASRETQEQTLENDGHDVGSPGLRSVEGRIPFPPE